MLVCAPRDLRKHVVVAASRCRAYDGRVRPLSGRSGLFGGHPSNSTYWGRPGYDYHDDRPPEDSRFWDIPKKNELVKAAAKGDPVAQEQLRVLKERRSQD